MGDQGAEPFLTRHDDLPAQRAWRAAKPGQHLLRPVSGLVADLLEALRPGQHAYHRDREHEHQHVPASPALAGIRDRRQHLQQSGNLITSLFVCSWSRR